MALERLLRQINMRRIPKRDTIVSLREAEDQAERERQELEEALQALERENDEPDYFRPWGSEYR